MHYIGRAMDKSKDPSLVFIVDPDVVYAREAARRLAEASITLNAITQFSHTERSKAPVVETLLVERVPTAWERARNVLIGLSLVAIIAASGMWVFNAGWVLGNEVHQETHIDQAPNVTGPLYNYNREQGTRE